MDKLLLAIRNGWHTLDNNTPLLDQNTAIVIVIGILAVFGIAVLWLILKYKKKEAK